MIVPALTLALATSAFAAWSPLGSISAPGEHGDLSRIAIDKKGNAMAVWRSSTLGSNTIQAAVRPVDGTFGAAQTLSAPSMLVTSPQILVDRKGNAIASWYRFDGTNDRAEAAFRPVGATFGAVQTISSGSGVGAPLTAFDRHGNATTVWAEKINGGPFAVQVAVRPVGGIFGTVQTIADPEGDLFPARIAIDTRANALAIWERFDLVGASYSVQVAVRPKGGSFAPALTISDPGEDTRTPQIAVDRKRNAIAVWSGFDGADFQARWAFRPAGGTFGAAQTISGGPGSTFPQIAVDKKGNATVVLQACPSCPGFAFVNVLAAVRPTGGTFGGLTLVSDLFAQSGDPQIAIDRKGNAIAVWQEGGIRAAVWPVGGPFGAPVVISGPGVVASSPQVAVDPKGRAIAVWQTSTGQIQAALYTP
jgi:hypothetical protein